MQFRDIIGLLYNGWSTANIIPESVSPVLSPSFTITPQGSAPTGSMAETVTPVIAPAFWNTPVGLAPTGSMAETVTPVIAPAFWNTPVGLAPTGSMAETVTPVIAPAFWNTPVGLAPTGSMAETVTPVIAPVFHNYTYPGSTFIDNFRSGLDGSWNWLNQLSSTAVGSNGLTFTKAGSAGYSLLVKTQAYAGVGSLNFWGDIGASINSPAAKGLVLYNSGNGRMILFVTTGGGFYVVGYVGYNSYSLSYFGPGALGGQRFLKIVITNQSASFYTSTDATNWNSQGTSATALWAWLGAVTHIGFGCAEPTLPLTSNLFVLV